MAAREYEQEFEKRLRDSNAELARVNESLKRELAERRTI